MEAEPVYRRSTQKFSEPHHRHHHTLTSGCSGPAHATIVGTMATAPPKRLYFDTNILRGWPNCSNEIWNIFNVANWLKTDLYIPKVVEDELEAQFIRGVHELLDALDTTVNQY